jgi:hypothetical protein
MDDRPVKQSLLKVGTTAIFGSTGYFPETE